MDTGKRAGREHAAPGETIGGYRLRRPLGRGGSARVWLGQHETTGGLAAVKLLKAEQTRDAEALFENERRALLRLRHPNIVSVFDYGDGYIATDYIEGVDLRHRLRSPLEVADAVRITRAIASALASAHRSGVVHCDVKPGNILLDRSGTPFLADFGISHLLTDTGVPELEYIAGTPAYMAPEQARGEVSPASDQYGLARTLLAMLIGGTPPTDLDAALETLGEGDADGLQPVLRRAMSQAPAERFPSVSAFARALDALNVPASSRFYKIAEPLRDAAPFAWVGAAHSIDRVGEITLARYRLSDLVEKGLIARAAADRFYEQTGHTDFGWTMYARQERLGPLSEPDSLARIREFVVLTHGLFVTREVWTDVAVGIARDNALAVAITPDVLGFGESRFARGVVPSACAPSGLARAIRSWLEMLGLLGIPCVMLAHSYAAVALLAVTDDDLGGATHRIAVAPVLYTDVWLRKAWALTMAAMALAFGWMPLPITEAIARPLFHYDPTLRRVLPSARDEMAREAVRVGFLALARVFHALAFARPAPSDSLERCIVVTTPDDPLVPVDDVDATVAAAGIPADQRFRLFYGGHFPQFMDESHPEWGARNVAELIQVVDNTLELAHASGLPTRRGESPTPEPDARPDSLERPTVQL